MLTTIIIDQKTIEFYDDYLVGKKSESVCSNKPIHLFNILRKGDENISKENTAPKKITVPNEADVLSSLLSSVTLFMLSENIFSITNERKDEYIIKSDEIARKEGYVQIEIPVHISTKQRKIEAWEYIHDEERPTVVIFHPNACTGSSMAKIGRYYQSREYNVLLPTMGGYPGSPGIGTSEVSVYQDIEAIKLYLSMKGVKHVGFHGMSLGGALAIHAASTENPESLNTFFIVADQTFTSAEEVAGNVATNCFGALFAGISKDIINAAVPKERYVELPGGKFIKTNGFNSKEKVKTIKEKKIPIFFIVASNDNFTGIGMHDQKKRL